MEIYEQQRINDDALMLRSRVAEVMTVESTQIDAPNQAYVFVGKLQVPSDVAYAALKKRFAEIAYAPLLRDDDNSDNQVIVALKGDLKVGHAPKPWINLLLLVGTLFTTVGFGGRTVSMMMGIDSIGLPDVLRNGIPFALSLLLILGVHELGHYLMARKHGLPVTLPFFIPMPFALGTLGAFIQMRGAVENKRALFDVGLAGPIAGLLVAIPLFVVGLLMATVGEAGAPPTRSYLTQILINIFLPNANQNGIEMSPVLIAARLGLIITAMNLLPVGQLDGGHVAYAAVGRRWARWIGWAVIAIMLVLGLTVSANWLVWLVFSLFSGTRHAAPLDDLTTLNLPRNLAFLGTVLLFLSLFTALPF